MSNNKKSLWSLLGLITVVCAVLAYVAGGNNVLAGLIGPPPVSAGPLTVRTDLVQDKVLVGSDGQMAVSLTLTAAPVEPLDGAPPPQTDLVVVLDRSGSMQGQKIDDARQAVLRLVDRLTARDRLALVAYANNVETATPLTAMDDGHRRQVKAAVQAVYADGGTNLGGGLAQGINLLRQTAADGRQRKVILISDGLANLGVTDPHALGRMASGAMEQNFTISSVGVGNDFNEVLMTTIADNGAGRYYYLENPNAFAQVFEKELNAVRHVAVSGLEIRVPLQPVHAGGYPVQVKEGYAVVHPGDLVSGQVRKLFLTFKVPTGREGEIHLANFEVNGQHNGAPIHLRSREKLTLVCVADKKAVLSSIDRDAWSDQVVQEDFNQLRETVADAVRKGERQEAIKQIHAYEARTRAVNAAVGSAKVAQNLDQELPGLRQSVEETFAGPPAAVAAKQKQTSKALQYESYKIRRDKK